MFKEGKANVKSATFTLHRSERKQHSKYSFDTFMELSLFGFHFQRMDFRQSGGEQRRQIADVSSEKGNFC